MNIAYMGSWIPGLRLWVQRCNFPGRLRACSFGGGEGPRNVLLEAILRHIVVQSPGTCSGVGNLATYPASTVCLEIRG